MTATISPSFIPGKLFKRDIGAIADDELRNYLRLYNIGAVVAFHPASVKKLLSIPGLVTVDRRIGPIHLMKVNQPLSWFVEGDGKVQAGANRLELRDLKGSEIVLKYHWVAGLNSEPAAKIEPVKLADDPIPFIKLIDSTSVIGLASSIAPGMSLSAYRLEPRHVTSRYYLAGEFDPLCCIKRTAS